MTEEKTSRRVAVVGGGITGLAAAHRIVELAPRTEVVLLEADSRIGGVLETVRQNGFSFERSADNFITNVPWAIDLCRRLGIEDQLLQTNNKFRQAFVVHRGRLCKIPEGFLIMAPSRIWPVLTTPILSPLGKLRLAGEYFVRPRRDDEDESLASFAKRRLGREAYERIVQPLVGGIYTADPEKLSVRATMPRFRDMERQHGSMIRAMWKKPADRPKKDQSSSGARYSMFVTPRHGLSSMVEAIAARLPGNTIRTQSPVEAITRPSDGRNGRWNVAISGPSPTQLEVDAVIIATPSHVGAKLLADVDQELARWLDTIQHSSCAVVSLGFRREQIGHPMDGFGFVVPLVENRQILSGSFSSVKYAGRAPDGCELIRVFVGGACQSDLVDLADAALIETVTRELADLMSIQGPPIFQHIDRWRSVMPQYHLGHQELVERIERRTAEIAGLELAGNAFHGVGIPNCIQSGEQAAERALDKQK